MAAQDKADTPCLGMEPVEALPRVASHRLLRFDVELGPATCYPQRHPDRRVARSRPTPSVEQEHPF